MQYILYKLLCFLAACVVMVLMHMMVLRSRDLGLPVSQSSLIHSKRVYHILLN